MTTQPVDREASPHYEIVFAVLLIFTVLEAGTAYLSGLPATIRVGLLVFLAVVKAALVLLYFMHLRFDRRVFALPFVLGVVLIIPLLLIVNLSTSIPPAHAEAVLPNTGAPGLGATGQIIDVTEVSFAIHMSKTTAQAGPVTFHIVNGADGMLHEFIIFQTDQPASELPTDMSGRVIEDALTIITSAENIPPASSRNITVNLGAGHYVMVCNLPDHYQQGMRVDFTVTGTNNEPPSTPESTGQPEQPTPGGDQSPTPATTATPGTGS